MDIEENTTIGLFIANKIKNALHSMKGEYKFMKKKAIKLATSTAIAASAFVAGAPVQKADAAVNVDQLVTDAQNAGTVLKWAISVEGSADYETQPWAQYNAAKKAIAAAEKAISAASASDKLKYEAKLTDPKIQVKRAQAYIDAITSSGKIKGFTADLTSAIASNDLDKVEKAYHTATAEYRKQAALLDRVYGQSTRDGIRSLVKPALEKAVADVKYEVTVHMLAKSAAADVKADKLVDAAKKLTEAQEYLDKNVKKWKTELQKSVTDVENSIPLKALSVTSDNKDTVTVKFSTKIQAGAGVIPAGQFTFTNGLIVQSASVAADGKTVTLKTTDQKANTTYALAYQGVSTGLSFTTPASAVDNTIGVVETEVANIDNGGERAYTVNVTKADGTAYTGKVKIELLAKATDKDAHNKSDVIVRSVNGQFVTQGDSSNPTSKAVYEVYAVNGKVTFVVKDNVGNPAVLTRATKDVVPKITRVEDDVYKTAPKTTFWKAADAKQYNRETVNATPTFDATNGFLYTEVKGPFVTEKVKFTVKAQDRFFINNTEVTKETFFKAYSRLDIVSFDYNSDKNYVSTFRIDVDVTADAELEITNPGVLTADTNATRLEGKGQPGHIIEVFKGTVVTAASHAVAVTTVDANGNWVVNSLNLDAGVKNDFTVVSRHISNSSLTTQEKVAIYQGHYATVANGLVAVDTNKDGEFNIGDKLVFTFNYAADLATKNNALKVADNATITLQDARGLTRVYTVAKDTVDKHNTLVVKAIETNKNDNYNYNFGNTLIAVSGITNQDNLVFNVEKSVDRIVNLTSGPVVTQGLVTFASATAIEFNGVIHNANSSTAVRYDGATIKIGSFGDIAVGDKVEVNGNVVTIVAKAADLANAAAVDATISGLKIVDSANPTIAEKTAISNARVAYNALTNPAKAQVTKLGTLEALEAIVKAAEAPEEADKAAVKAVKDAVAENDKAKFIAALKNVLFKKYVAANDDAYWAAKGAISTPATVALIDAQLDIVNNAEVERLAVKALKDAVTKTDFLAALKNSLFTAYNSANDDAYWLAEAAIRAGGVTTVAHVNTQLNQVNVDEVAAAIPATFAATGAVNTVVMPTVPAGYTIAVKTSGTLADYSATGQVLQTGSSVVVYTVTHTASGLTADTGNVTVTVTVTP